VATTTRRRHRNHVRMLAAAPESSGSVKEHRVANEIQGEFALPPAVFIQREYVFQPPHWHVRDDLCLRDYV